MHTDRVTDAELDEMLAARERERIEHRKAFDRDRARKIRAKQTREARLFKADQEALSDTPHGAVHPSFWNDT